MRMNSLFSLALLASSVIASAQETPQAEPSPAAEKMVCRSVAVTGSRLGRKRICMPASQAKLEEERARRDAERANRPSGF